MNGGAARVSSAALWPVAGLSIAIDSLPRRRNGSENRGRVVRDAHTCTEVAQLYEAQTRVRKSHS
jgi:hypothetical protein